MSITSYNPADPADLVVAVEAPGAEAVRAAVGRARAPARPFEPDEPYRPRGGHAGHQGGVAPFEPPVLDLPPRVGGQRQPARPQRVGHVGQHPEQHRHHREVAVEVADEGVQPGPRRPAGSRPVRAPARRPSAGSPRRSRRTRRSWPR
ncbi:hypothetical protein HS99_0008365 [Kitasatospora aureofaciens]|uniref:Uncharacterized protein n=1 Tax=Kitasatospora aureofaciens TaxID=1894 RepID=A0A1E7N598_KITAU|nr:hypothetical protein HS99_0008365 [Kitasatospora aureofaciens]